MSGHRANLAATGRGVGEGLLALGLTVGAVALLEEGLAEADRVLLFLLPVAWVAARHPIGVALPMAVAAVLAFNWFFVSPRYTFRVDELRYVVTFAVMAAVGASVSWAAGRLRDQVAEARAREALARGLAELSRELAAAVEVDEVARAAVRGLGLLGVAPVWVFRVESDGERLLAASPGAPSEVGAVAAVRRAAAGAVEVEGSPGLPVRARPVFDRGRVVAVVGWSGPGDERLDARAAVSQVDVALGRALAAEDAANTRRVADLERVRGALLGSVSHDLRTPLGAIKGAATALLSAPIGPERQRELLVGIDAEADRLTRLLRNLLQITRLEGGPVVPDGGWSPPEEVLGSALRVSRALLGDRPVAVELPAPDALVWLDPVLVELALVNLLENTARHGAGPVDLSARVGAGRCVFAVSDRGPGLRGADPDGLFAPFVRGGGRAPGVGLGLAICAAVASVHGGRARAADRAGGGATFTLDLPVGGPAGFTPPALEPA